MYKRDKINPKELRKALRETDNFILMNLQDLLTVQSKGSEERGRTVFVKQK